MADDWYEVAYLIEYDVPNEDGISELVKMVDEVVEFKNELGKNTKCSAVMACLEISC